MAFINKISISGMGCVPARAKTEKKEVPMAKIFGVATGLKAKKGNNDEITMAIIGNFEGVNLETGEVYQSAVLYLPSGIQEAMESPLRADDAKPIEFSIQIDAIPAANPAGYSYKVHQLHKPDVADPLEKLRAITAGKGHQMALSASAETETKKVK